MNIIAYAIGAITIVTVSYLCGRSDGYRSGYDIGYNRGYIDGKQDSI